MLTEIAITTAGSAIGSEIADSIIEKATKSIDQIVENASIRFSNAGQDLIAQIRVSIEELKKQIGDDITKTVNELTDTLKVQLYNLTITIEKLSKTTIEDINEISSNLLRDIRATLSKTWFMSEIYALDEISGTLIDSSLQSDWLITASGLNLGFDSEKIESTVKLKVFFPNSTVYEVIGAEKSSHTVEFVIPAELIEEFRKDNTLTLINAELEVRIKKDGILWFDKKFKGTQSFIISIAPRISGHLFIRSIVPDYGWVKNPELDVVYSNSLPSGHASSSSDVRHHRITRYFYLPKASVPPKLGDRRFYGAERGACTGGGCSHLHEVRIKVINNGSTLDVYTYNNSHAITVRIKGKVERYEKTGDTSYDFQPIPIINDKIIEIKIPKTSETIMINGRDLDFGIIDLLIKCDPLRNFYPMPSGEFGGLVYLGNHIVNNDLVYRFTRKSV
jgi:vacuolar-type H+-ATPase subunit H